MIVPNEPSAMGIVKGRGVELHGQEHVEAEPERGSMATPWPRRSASPLNSNGFTLLELLLAIALLAVVAGIVYGSFRATASAIDQATTGGAAARQARVVLALLADELTSADWSKDRPETIFVGTSGDQDGHPAAGLRFTTRSHIWYPTQPLAIERAVIDYAVDAAPSGLRLWRSEEANPFLLESRPENYIIAEGLAGVRFRYFSDEAWVETWDAAESNQLPQLVEIVLTFEGERAQPEEFHTMVSLPKKGP